VVGMLKKITKNEFIVFSFFILVIGIVILLYFIPPEQKLGNTIKIVFLHAAFVQVGILTFLTAGILSIIWFIHRNKNLYVWIYSVQITAVFMWAVYYLSSMIATYYAWGILIAWQEPRVQMTFWVFAFATVFLLVSWWLKNPYFSSVLNIILMVIVFYLVLTTINIRHPGNPIGESNSFLYKGIFFTLIGVVAVFSVQIMRLVNLKIQKKILANSRNSNEDHLY